MHTRALLFLLLRWLILALGVTLATKLIDGISCTDKGTLLVVVVLLSFFNAVLRPVLVLFSLPFIVLTLGLGVIVINALLFMLVGALVPGFEVAGFWSALGGALIVGLTNLFCSRLLGGGGPPSQGPGSGGGAPKRPLPPQGRGDVIDV
jgi:putative membrane protein